MMETILKERTSPFYFYDLDAFEEHLQSIQKVRHPGIKLWYACKANPLSSMLSILNTSGLGLDVASPGEFEQGLHSGFSPRQMLATGPAKSKNYLKTLMSQGISVIIIESYRQLKWCDEVAQELGIKQKILLRVQLDWRDDEKSVLGGTSITPFGLGIEDWKDIPVMNYSHVDIQGLHCFQWGNILDLKRFEHIWTTTIEACLELSRFHGFSLSIMDLGGGVGLSYPETQPELHFAELQNLLLKLRDQFKLNEIWLELGRFLAGNFGSYFTPIEDIKSVRGKNLIITQGGINHLARPALTGESFPCKSLRSSDDLLSYGVHGPLCTSMDYLGEFFLPSDLTPGEWLRFSKAGAYGFTESMPYFLCHRGVSEWIKYRGEIKEVRESMDVKSWMR